MDRFSRDMRSAKHIYCQKNQLSTRTSLQRDCHFLNEDLKKASEGGAIESTFVDSAYGRDDHPNIRCNQ